MLMTWPSSSTFDDVLEKRAWSLVDEQWQMWKPPAKASVAQTASGWWPRIVPSIRTCQQNSVSQNDTQWKNHKLMFLNNLPQKFIAILEEKIHDRGFENLEKTHLCNCSSFMPLTSPASLLIMSSGILRSTWREELSKVLDSDKRRC